MHAISRRPLRRALRGGSHVHVFSPDGSRLSFTYNDHVMHELDISLDLRNVGIAVPLKAVKPENSIRANMMAAIFV